MRSAGVLLLVLVVAATATPARPARADGMPDHVMVAVNRHGPALRRCFDRLAVDPSSSGKLTVRFRVGRDGRTGAVHVVGARSTLRHRGLEACVRKVFRAIRFRRTGRATWYTSPLIFGAATRG